MKRIQDYNECEINGIVVAIPKSPFQYDNELYIYGRYINHNNEIEYHRVDYSKEDSDMFSTIKLNGFKDVFHHFDDFIWYQFEDLGDFCNWYILYQEGETKKTQEKVYYFEQKYGFNPYEEQAPDALRYWEIYNDENCDNELKRIIEKEWPEIKELASLDAKIIKNKISNTYTFDEIRDIMNTGWNTRREKLKDVLKLLELRDMRQHTIDSLMQSTDRSMQEYLGKQLERDEKRIEDFLNEKIS